MAILFRWKALTWGAVRNLRAGIRCSNKPRPPAVMRCSAPGRPAVFVSLLILLMALFGFGFLRPISRHPGVPGEVQPSRRRDSPPADEPSRRKAMIHAVDGDDVREWRNLDDLLPDDVSAADQEEAIFKLCVVRHASCTR
jgi:hypothetical protein